VVARPMSTPISLFEMYRPQFVVQPAQ